MADSAARNTMRLKIKKTVEEAVPQSNIDVTQILTEEEVAEIHRQMAQRKEAQKLAAELGRTGLKARLKRTVFRETRMYDPETDGPLKSA